MLYRLALIGWLLLTLPACAELDQSLNVLGLPSGKGLLDENRIAAGLKEALQIGTGNAVNVTGTVDGYFHNQAIKILMPDQLQAFEKGLRTFGFGPKIDDFVMSMNRAAERAAPQAKQIFLGTIREMSFADANQILEGSQTAATDYFRGKTTEKLTAAFRPEVEKAMNDVGVTKQYKELVGHFKAIPFAKSDSVDIDRYVVGKSLDGLFLMLAEEERKIRTNPAARVTDLLKEVFAKAGRS
ncbi:MAG: DUF4197 domain-containing protein [Nitrospirota bacterium]|nr:DUF4197 domain-containing protein [Nitrospirota bacterium]MDP3595880.1 DUF4197 domain-containing protein [Nitrospirota bacterium]